MKKIAGRILIALVALVAATTAGYFAGDLVHQTAVSASLKTQQEALKLQQQAVYGQCHRINVARITGNRNNYVQYKLWDSAITLLKYTPPSQQKQIDPEETTLFNAFLAAMQQTLRSESWTPLSNCISAVQDPAHYQPPAAVQFVTHLPPDSAFTLEPGE